MADLAGVDELCREPSRARMMFSGRLLRPVRVAPS